MTAAYTKMHPNAVMLLSFGLDNLIVLHTQTQMEENEANDYDQINDVHRHVPIKRKAFGLEPKCSSKQKKCIEPYIITVIVTCTL